MNYPAIFRPGFRIFCSGENLTGIVFDEDGATGARGLSTLAPWSMAVHGGHQKKDRTWWSRGLAPLGCLPLWGSEGVTRAIPLSAHGKAKQENRTRPQTCEVR